MLSLACALGAPRTAAAFGQEGAFHPRMLMTGKHRMTGPRATAPGRWASELVRRTSAPARMVFESVSADDPKLLAEPFAMWAGEGEIQPLSRPEVRGLERFIRLGGLLVVDDFAPENGVFGKAARRELRRVLPASPVVKLDESHVIHKTYYIIDRPVGRIAGPPQLEGIVRGNTTQVVLLSHDLLGALARSRGGSWLMDVTPGGFRQREYAIRLAVNLAMYLLCSDYKDDQVHAPWLMRRRAHRRP